MYETPQYLLLLLIADPVGHRVGREQVERLRLGDSEHEVGRLCLEASRRGRRQEGSLCGELDTQPGYI